MLQNYYKLLKTDVCRDNVHTMKLDHILLINISMRKHLFMIYIYMCVYMCVHINVYMY